VRISQFQEHTTEDFAKALTKLHETNNLKGLVIDLRNNPGGLLNSAIGVSAAFLPHNALVVSTRGRDADSERLFKATLEDYRTSVKEKDFIASLPATTRSVPIVVLINPASASASEIVAGALQDHKRATIMGSRSFGKGSVQTILSLRVKGENTNGLKLTTARYYTPSGRTIQAKGITPDIAVDDTPEGNYPSFNLREADLAHHLEDKTNKRNEHNEDSEEDAIEDHEFTMPKLRYVFGDEKDFPLQQAKAHLLGQKVVTHEDVQAKLKAERQAQDSAKKKDQPE
jgi:carboxyl-terminal processing protease